MTRIQRIALVLAAAAVPLLSAAGASAQDAGAGGKGVVKQQAGVLQVGEITIVGRIQKPVAAVDVATIQVKITLTELRQPFLDRIEEAVHKEPF
jgi:hypothetical protein